jgi:hypothetical protein
VASFYDIDKLEEFAKRFYANIGSALSDLSLDKHDTVNLSTVALYDVMILCGAHSLTIRMYFSDDEK